MYSAPDLAALVAVADTGSVRAAATALGRTQPAVTQAVRRLEAAVGFALLDRSGYRARLTERGETFVKRARVSVAQARGLRALATLLAKGIEPRLRIAVHSAIPTEAWVGLVQDLSRRFPDTSVEIEAGEGNAPLRRFMDGEAHLALLLDPFPERYATSVERRDLGQIEYVNVVRADRLGELQGGLPQIPQVLASDFDDLTTSFALDEGRLWRVSDHRMKVAAIAAGAGWGYVPRPLVEAELRAGTLCATSCFGVSERGARAFALYRRRDLPRGPVAELIWETAGTPRERA
jgi:DNA-binding transcriptional LysR family regulator